MKTFARLTALTAVALAAALPAQNRGAGAAGQKPTAPMQAPQQHQQQQQVQQQHQTQQPMESQVRAREAEWNRRRDNDPGFVARWQNAVQNMQRFENTYRIRTARLERIRSIYREQGRTDRVQQLDQLRTRLNDRYREQLQQCRMDLGDADYDMLRDRIRDRDRDRVQDQTNR